MIINDALQFLGVRVRDAITNFEGVVTGILFDVNGCVQASVVPVVDKDSGKRRDAEWFDVKRLKFLLVNHMPDEVVPRPEFRIVRLGEEPGPSHVPVDRKMPAPP